MKPAKCCDIGSYDCQVPMPIAGRVRGIDLCLADIVAALNAAGIETVASCCGHGLMPGEVTLKDGREIAVYWCWEKKSVNAEVWDDGNSSKS